MLVAWPELLYQSRHRQAEEGEGVVSQPCLLWFSSLGRLGCRVPRMTLNVEVNLCGLLGLGKSDLSDDEYWVQLGSSEA
ncbi:hypothetical protein Tco_0651001 [Tanacetum coccineum]